MTCSVGLDQDNWLENHDITRAELGAGAGAGAWITRDTVDFSLDILILSAEGCARKLDECSCLGHFVHCCKGSAENVRLSPTLVSIQNLLTGYFF